MQCWCQFPQSGLPCQQSGSCRMTVERDHSHMRHTLERGRITHVCDCGCVWPSCAQQLNPVIALLSVLCPQVSSSAPYLHVNHHSCLNYSLNFQFSDVSQPPQVLIFHSSAMHTALVSLLLGSQWPTRPDMVKPGGFIAVLLGNSLQLCRILAE